MNRFLHTSLLLIGSMACLHASTIEFSYNQEKGEMKQYGYDTPQNYDIAIMIDNPDFAGSRLTSFTVPIPVDESQISNYRGWISSELKVEDSDGVQVNAPDITEVEGVLADGMLTVTFSEPYVFTGEPVYVGYSFDSDIENPAKRPIACAISRNPNGFFMRTSKTRPIWASLVQSTNYNSMMVLSIEGDFPENGAKAIMPDRVYVDAGESFTIDVTVANVGMNPVQSVEYKFEAGKYSGTANYVWPAAVDGYYGVEFPATFYIDPINEAGNHDLKVSITKVNGEPNGYDDPGSVTNLVVQGNMRPVKRPLAEEYTGLWCSFCPGGYVVMEELAEEYPETFVGIAYHYNDQMEPQNLGNGFPAPVTSYPAATLDRVGIIDALALKRNYKNRLNTLCNVTLDVDAYWVDESQEMIEIETTYTFIENLDNVYYRIAHILVADGFEHPSFLQNNGYSQNPNRTSEQTGKWWDLFFDGPGYVQGLTFNFVALYSDATLGWEGSMPVTIPAYYPLTYRSRIDCRDVVNKYGEDMVNVYSSGYDKARVVSAIIDNETGQVLNCNISGYIHAKENGDHSLVNGAGTAAVVNTDYYDLKGMKVSNPEAGLYLRVDTLADGSRRVSKTLIK